MDSEVMTLSNTFEAMFSAFENHVKETGIQCSTRDCVFFDSFHCHLRTVRLGKGTCPHYNPKLTFDDVWPKAQTGMAPQDRKK